MNNDLISRQAAIDAADRADYIGLAVEDVKAVTDEVVKELKKLPCAERKKGKWIVGFVFEDCRYVKCNQCNVTQVFHYNKPLANFCPNCGADMRGEQE